MLVNDKFYNVWLFVGEDDPNPPSDPPNEPSETPESFTQEDINNAVEKERTKFKATQQKLLTELQALRSKSKLTDDERKELDGRIESLQTELMTKEEIAKKNEEKLLKKHEQELSEVSTSRDAWKQRYTDSLITTNITNAAITNNAFNPSHIDALLRPNTFIREIEKDGEKTGQFEVRVKLNSKNSKGEPVVLDLNPDEAVKHLKEQEEHMPLFKGEGSSGLGFKGSSGKDKDWDKMSFEEYDKARKEGKFPGTK